MLQLIFYFSLFLFFLVSNSLSYITIPQNKGNKKLTEINCNIYIVSLINVSCLFCSFCCVHVARKAFSNVKHFMQKEWTNSSVTLDPPQVN